jgi:hypothetical protein
MEAKATARREAQLHIEKIRKEYTLDGAIFGLKRVALLASNSLEL